MRTEVKNKYNKNKIRVVTLYQSIPTEQCYKTKLVQAPACELFKTILGKLLDVSREQSCSGEKMDWII